MSADLTFQEKPALVFKSVDAFQAWRRGLGDKSVGFVPTMGALHQGHATLLKRARAENEIVVLSIYVNPTQFNDKKDFDFYPTTWEADVALAASYGVDVILNPTFSQIYPDGYRYKVIETNFSHELCGRDRPGHFDGVLTVVMKLLNIVRPTRAYFGEKDFQQLSLVRDMAKAFFMDCEIVPVPTVREADGLAMSSRNTRLTPEQRAVAPNIYRALTRSDSAETAVDFLVRELGLPVDYVEDRDGRRFAAVRVGDVRLIDNVEL